MGAGRISYSHARAISRLAECGCPRLVAELVTVAEHGTVGQLEDMVRGLRSVDDNQREPAARDPEVVSHRWRSDSRFGFSAKLDPEHGALLQCAIETIARRENLTQAHALTRIAEIALATVAAAGERPAPSLRGDEHAALVNHLHATPEPEHTEPELEPTRAEPDVAESTESDGAEVRSAEHSAATDAGGADAAATELERLAGALAALAEDAATTKASSKAVQKALLAAGEGRSARTPPPAGEARRRPRTTPTSAGTTGLLRADPHHRVRLAHPTRPGTQTSWTSAARTGWSPTSSSAPCWPATAAARTPAVAT